MKAARLLRSVLTGGVCWLALGVGSASAETVHSVELRGDAAPGRVEGLMELLSVVPGAELDPEDVRKSLRNLQASGQVGRARAEVSRGPDGARVVFRIYTRLQASSVETVGNDCLRDSELRGALNQRPQTPLSESRILRGVYRMQDLLHDAGYLEASVVVAVEVDRSENRAAVAYHVECGQPTLIAGVRFTGDLGPFTTEELTGPLKLTEGRKFRRARLSDETERLETWLGGKGYRSAEIGVPRQIRGSDGRSLVLDYPISIGPLIELTVSGYEAAQLRKRGLLAGLERERFDEALLLQTVERIRHDFQSRGHYGASVRGKMTERDQHLLVGLFIEPGPVYALKQLEFSGNQLVTSSELVERMATTPERFLAAGSGRLADDVLDEDLANLRSYYALEGFSEATVGPAEVRVGGSNRSIEVTIPIVEGTRRRVVELAFVGVTAFDPTTRPFPIRAGGPFHPRRLEDTVAEIRALCEDLGYLSAQVASRVEWNATGTLATVTIEVLEGPRVIVDRIIIRGNADTRTEVIDKSVRLESGDPVSRRRLLAVQRELYRLGIFSKVEVRLAPAMPFASSRDVLIRLEEGRPRKGSVGFGYDSEDGLRTLLGYSHGNLFGRAVATRFDLRLSERERQARLLFRQPFLGRFRAPITYSIFGVEQQKESFDSERRGVQVDTEVGTGQSTFGLLLTAKQVRVVDPDPALEAIEIERELQEVDILSLTPRVLIDRRNDPLVPTRGWTLGVQTEYAFPALGGSAEFVKLFGQQTSYLDLGRLGVLAGSVRVGAIEPLDELAAADPTVPAGLDSALVPISERFFAGGRTTHRAYRRDLLGVPGETLLLVDDGKGGTRRVPIGGNGLLLANLDYRFPVAGAVGGTVFVDAGNVFGDLSGIDPGELEVGAGVGLRYLSPIGPLRFEVGWKVDREPGQSEAVVFLSFGNPF